MRHDWSISVFLLFATLLGYSQPTGNSNGRIEGTVVNEEGQLVEHAMVCTSLTTGSSTTINCQTPTDKDGRFQIRDLKFGAYHVFVIKEDGGYSIENQTPGDQVQITEDSPFSVLAIRLKPKGAILVGSVRDKTTGQPLRKFHATYLNIDGGERGGGGGGGLEENGKFRMTVPVDSDLVVAIYALGYKGWVYTDPANPSRPVLRVVSGETRRLEVEMEPTDTTSR
jgi:hypothetical protein